jgi:hypothetical protein
VVATGTKLTDGVNETLSYTVPVGSGGKYYVVVTGQNGTQGEFYLDDPVTYAAAAPAAGPAPEVSAPAAPVRAEIGSSTGRSTAGAVTPGTSAVAVFASANAPMGTARPASSVVTGLAGADNGAVMRGAENGVWQVVLSPADNFGNGPSTTRGGDAGLGAAAFSSPGSVGLKMADEGLLGKYLLGQPFQPLNGTVSPPTDDLETRNPLFGTLLSSAKTEDDADLDGLVSALLLGGPGEEGADGGE